MGLVGIIGCLALGILGWSRYGIASMLLVWIFYLAVAAVYVRWARTSRFSLFYDNDSADFVYSLIFPMDYGNQPWSGSDDQWLEVAIGWPFVIFCELLRVLCLPFVFLGWIITKLPRKNTEAG